MKTIELQNVVWREGSHYVAQCLNVDVSSFGDTKEEALVNLDEALSLYFEDSKDMGMFHEVRVPEITHSSVKYA